MQLVERHEARRNIITRFNEIGETLLAYGIFGNEESRFIIDLPKQREMKCGVQMVAPCASTLL